MATAQTKSGTAVTGTRRRGWVLSPNRRRAPAPRKDRALQADGGGGRTQCERIYHDDVRVWKWSGWEILCSVFAWFFSTVYKTSWGPLGCRQKSK